jgi:hypothetical protein
LARRDEIRLDRLLPACDRPVDHSTRSSGSGVIPEHWRMPSLLTSVEGSIAVPEHWAIGMCSSTAVQPSASSR